MVAAGTPFARWTGGGFGGLSWRRRKGPQIPQILEIQKAKAGAMPWTHLHRFERDLQQQAVQHGSMRVCVLLFPILVAVSAPASLDEAGFVELLTPAKATEWQQCGKGGLTHDRGVWTTQNEITADGPRGGVHWYAARTFANFVLRFEFRADRPGADSGIFVRIPAPVKNDDPWSLPKRSHEVHLSGGGTKMPSGSIMSFQEASGVRQKTLGQWNQVEIVADGQQLQISINGKRVTSFQSTFANEGYLGIQNHYTGSMQFRNFRLKELP